MPSCGDLPHAGTKPTPAALAGQFLTTEPPGRVRPSMSGWGRRRVCGYAHCPARERAVGPGASAFLGGSRRRPCPDLDLRIGSPPRWRHLSPSPLPGTLWGARGTRGARGARQGPEDREWPGPGGQVFRQVPVRPAGSTRGPRVNETEKTGPVFTAERDKQYRERRPAPPAASPDGRPRAGAPSPSSLPLLARAVLS